jgi:ABC-type Fe3+ transport system permease subunit
MEIRPHLDPREERYVQEEFPRRAEKHRRPWYNRGWVWMIIVLIALCAVVAAIGTISDRLADVNGSIREQTEELRRQTGILTALSHGVSRIVTAIQNGIDRIVDAVNGLKGS